MDPALFLCAEMNERGSANEENNCIIARGRHGAVVGGRGWGG